MYRTAKADLPFERKDPERWAGFYTDDAEWWHYRKRSYPPTGRERDSKEFAKRFLDQFL